MPMTRRALLGTSAAFALCGPAAAQVWPDRPIRLIVPFPPGGGTDVISRQLAERVGANTRWTIVIENRAGAGGTLGLDAVAKAPPDGYTIGMGQASNLTVNPSLYPKCPTSRCATSRRSRSSRRSRCSSWCRPSPPSAASAT